MSNQAQVVEGGYYLERIRSKVGTGDTERETVMENYWIVRSVEGDKVVVELLDINDQPSGYTETVDLEEFSRRFIHQPDFKPKQLKPKERLAEQHAARGERHLAQNEFLSAEYEFLQSLKYQQNNVRANFGLGKTYLALGETDKAKEAFKRLAEVDELLEPRYKHIFNELGIQLRKLGMYAEAVKHYSRALKIEDTDEHLWFNLGRALYEGGQKQKGIEAMKKALRLNPTFPEARAYLKAIGEPLPPLVQQGQQKN